MAISVIMPRQGQSVESCLITKWHKKKGDSINTGDILFSFETDKSSFDEEAKADGTLLDIFFEEGDDVPVLTNVCVIGNEGEDAAVFNPKLQGSNAVEAAAAGKPVGESMKGEEGDAPGTVRDGASGPVHAGEMGRISISPRARSLAEKLGIDYRHAIPSGPDGRIVEKDIMALHDIGPIVTPAARDEYIKSSGEFGVPGTGLGGRITTRDLKDAAVNDLKETTAKYLNGAAVQDSKDNAVKDSKAAAVQDSRCRQQPGDTGVNAAHPAESGWQPHEGLQYEELKLTNIRKIIAKAMHNSISSTAQLTLNSSFDAGEIIAYRKKLKENMDKLGIGNITLNDIILYAVSRTLLNHRHLNAHFVEDRMLLFKNVHLGVAVSTERGLMVPTVFNADTKSLNTISCEVKKLAEECQKGTIKPDFLKGAGFTVTNLGALDIESFTPISNPPQTGILGVNNIIQRVREVNGEYKYYPAMGLSLTFDHRAIDGAPAARFLQELKRYLENFSVMLAG